MFRYEMSFKTREKRGNDIKSRTPREKCIRKVKRVLAYVLSFLALFLIMFETYF